MRINYNATAMLAVNALNKNDNDVSVSTGRLSSGYKINRAKDNPSGYAMSRKMRAQLDGLMQARDNTDTGVNIIKAVDGALSEVHDMLQRLNELAIKGANGTLSDGDREMVDEEVQKLKEEIQRISETFEFNGQKLLDGSFQLKGYVDNQLSVKVAGYNDRMRVGEYILDLKGFTDNIPLETAGGNKIKDLTLYDKDGNFNPDNVYALWQETVKVPADPVEKPDPPAGVDPDDIKWDPGKKKWGYTDAGTGEWAEVPFTEPAKWDADKGKWGYVAPDTGAWTELPPDWTETIDIVNQHAEDFPLEVIGPDNKQIEPVYVSDANGTVMTLKGPNGFELKLDITEEFLKTPDADKEKLKVNLTGLGAMTVQVGANEGQELAIEIPDIGLKGLGIELINTATKEDSLEAITRVSVAINRLSGIRSKLGAYQNRLESVVTSNEINHENMTAAYSGILDTDMSEEYTNYSTYQILSQASTSVLAQANERPSQVLQLLQ